MPLRYKQLKYIDEQDLRTLAVNKVKEGKTIEYKAELPGNRDKDKKDFLADVSSFANAAGGDLIYGIRAKDGVPKEPFGIEISNADAAVLRLDSMIRDGIAPRIPGHRT